MNVLRTPDDRFADLPGFDHPPRYAEVPDGEGGRLRMSYVEAGPADGPVVFGNARCSEDGGGPLAAVRSALASLWASPVGVFASAEIPARPKRTNVLRTG